MPTPLRDALRDPFTYCCVAGFLSLLWFACGVMP